MVMTSSAPISLFVGNHPGQDGFENQREWGEERDDDVIYAITLKRVNRVVSSPLHKPSEGLQWETQKVRNIKGATLSYLIQHLCRCYMEECDERHFLTVFLATYRSFASSEDVLNAIIEQKNALRDEPSESKRQIVSSIIRVLRTWLERFFDEDFFDPPLYSLLKKLQQFVENCRSADGVKISDFLAFIKTKMKNAERRKSRIITDSSGSIQPRFSTYLPLFNNSTSEVERCDGKSVNADAVNTFLNILTPTIVAEQLTLIDANFFLNVVPHHCLYAVRSSRGKPATVKATIDQFNRVVYCVLATCLHLMLKPSQRVKVFCKWIEIAQMCRELKNFSSLRAVISGLQAHPVHRLKRIWQLVPHRLSHLMKELEQINTKDSILKVGTAKVNTERSSIHRVRKNALLRRQQDLHSGIMHGTVPYLGSFLSDLTYLHTAKPDYLEEGIINFEKRRKEFELLAQLRLWQVSCRSYHHLKLDSQFSSWFNSVTLPTDEQAIKLSEELEPPATTPLSPIDISCKRSEVFAAQHNSLPSSGCTGTSLPAGHSRPADLSPHSKESAPKLNGHVTNSTTCVDGERTVQVQIVKKNSDVQLKANEKAKEVKLSSNDRSPAFVRKAFNLFELDEDVHNFQVMQILPGDKQLTIPDNGNVFYAMNSSLDEFNFKLVEKGAAIPREKPDSQGQRSPFFKKKNSRKLQTSAPSPMKTIYKHLGIIGFSWANSGNYSPSKVFNRQESMRDLKDSSGNKSSKVNAKKSSHSEKSANSNWPNNSFSELVEVYTPLETSLPSDGPCSSKAEPRSSSTWPRSQTFASHDVNEEEAKLQRRTAIRKHHSHPRETTDKLSVLPPINPAKGGNSSVSSTEYDIMSAITKRQSESSNNFVNYGEHLNSRLVRHASADILEESLDNITEFKENELRRSASDPCVLDSIESQNDVFDAPEFDFKASNFSPPIRRSSQTTTTYL